MTESVVKKLLKKIRLPLLKLTEIEKDGMC